MSGGDADVPGDAVGVVDVATAVVAEIDISLPQYLPCPVETTPQQETNYLDGDAVVVETMVDAFPVSVRVRVSKTI